MSGVEQPCYTLINFPRDTEPYNELQLKVDLEKGDAKKKAEALKKVIGIILAGDKIPGLLMIIIRFVLPLQDHTIKKLLLIFWEIVPKTSSDGKLLQEMILVCDAYRKDLQHPNEFIRGSTLRFLCKLKEPELLEPLMPAIRACLDHRHSYVRRNAVLAIFTIYRNFETLIPDARELVANFLENEQDMSCKRNAFLMLLHADQERALTYLASRLDNVNSFGDILQLVIVELIYKVCHANPSERGRFIRTVYALLNSNSAAVRYEAAGTLVTLSTAPAALKAAASCYIDLIVKESDNNVKLIVLERLSALASNTESARALGDLAMDVLRVLPASDMAARETALQLALKLVPSRQAEQLVTVLRKEAARATDADFDQRSHYRRLLVKALGQAAFKFPEVAGAVFPALVELVGAGSDDAASDVLLLLRAALQRYPHHRDSVLQRVVEILPGIKAAKCARAALWLVAQFSAAAGPAGRALTLLADTLALDDDRQENENTGSGDAGPGLTSGSGSGSTSGSGPGSTRTLVTSDGTYATQSAFTANTATAESDSCTGLRQAILSGESYTASCAVAAIAKLAQKLPVEDRNKALHLAAGIIAHRQKTPGANPLTADDMSRASLSLWALTSSSEVIRDALLEKPLQMLPQAPKVEEETGEEETQRVVDVESGISFVQLSGPAAAAHHDMFELALSRAVSGRRPGANPGNRLSKVTQLTGFSDPVYAEAIVSVNQYDIVLDILLVNQTDDTLQACAVELATLGELRLLERPAAAALAPRDFLTLQAHLKVASTESGLIFGNVVYEVAGSGTAGGVVVLNDIHVDIVDYITPAHCSDHDFRRMWAEFEWENKVSVNTNMTELRDYLDHLLKNTNMKCLTPEKALSGSCGFMAANLYARSIFGEDALANVSLERPTGLQPVLGHVRIRAKTQGMALSLGDKINMMQKAAMQKSVPPPQPAA